MRYQKSRTQDCIKNGLWKKEDEGRKDGLQRAAHISEFE